VGLRFVAILGNGFNPHPLRSERVTPLLPRRTLQKQPFQSTPAPIGAGDPAGHVILKFTGCFNPHPLRSERVTYTQKQVLPVTPVSIHTRSDRSG